MTDISATDAARRFSDLLDGVEHRGEEYTIVRHGKRVAHLTPAPAGRGLAAKELLLRHRPDPDWRREVEEIRAILTIEDRG
ncbi:MAG: type II toxin-antitoxin system prevent-host-death family antitoxin [Acidimicrobiia bacterium]